MLKVRANHKTETKCHSQYISAGKNIGQHCHQSYQRSCFCTYFIPVSTFYIKFKFIKICIIFSDRARRTNNLVVPVVIRLPHKPHSFGNVDE